MRTNQPHSRAAFVVVTTPGGFSFGQVEPMKTEAYSNSRETVAILMDGECLGVHHEGHTCGRPTKALARLAKEHRRPMSYIYLVAALVAAGFLCAIIRAFQIIGIILDYEDQKREGEE